MCAFTYTRMKSLNIKLHYVWCYFWAREGDMIKICFAVTASQRTKRDTAKDILISHLIKISFAVSFSC